MLQPPVPAAAETTDEGAAATELTLILEALHRLHAGDLTVHLPTGGGGKGTSAEIAEVFNRHVQMLNDFAGEMTRLSREMGTEAHYGGQMEVRGLSGTWNDVLRNLNKMAASLTDQIRDLGNVTRALEAGDANKRLSAACQGEMASLHATINRLLDAKRLGSGA